VKRALVFLVAGIVVGELDPMGWAVWQVLERQLPRVKQESLAAPSPFEEMPSSAWLAESEHAYVVQNRYAPTAPVHLLVVPKRRYSSILEPAPEILGEMLDLARSAAREQGIAESGFRITINTNPHGPQTVYHLHMHVAGGRQLREPLLPFLWSRMTRLWRSA
jgi:histidine triad (HIT) family protein